MLMYVGRSIQWCDCFEFLDDFVLELKNTLNLYEDPRVLIPEMCLILFSALCMLFYVCGHVLDHVYPACQTDWSKVICVAT
jgi:hypothetical protein